MEYKDIKLIICKDRDEVGKTAAQIFEQAIRDNPGIVLGLATGGTPIDMYQELIRLHREKSLDFCKLKSFNLDEYLGLSPDHSQSYRYFMDNNFFNHININKSNTHVLNGLSENPELECKRFEDAILEAGGIDLQLLGIGANGHIAFNEPGSSLDSRTRVVNLTQKTIEDNARFFEKSSDVPRQALTMGIATILEVKKVVLLGIGKVKAEAIGRAFNGPMTSEVPASYLHYQPDCTFIIDKEAAQNL
jgi:glucosamine-6-phosphate deaminase